MLNKVKTEFDEFRLEMTEMKHEVICKTHMTTFLDISRRATSDEASKDSSAPTEPTTIVFGNKDMLKEETKFF
ncbi:hypothetical protein L596_001199 [Steinernema carpocapsae]|uniref:Uncharacterized protein n=1 Tax=Steinernema carpocapsae TaxID=34508 RepID=A0A4V6I7B4_STECR|nr:hypothetical protein L596_001199 [Steinernema carpocapsae]